jgi:PPM family protein phosphatase
MVNTRLKFAGGTDPGRIRRNNEDAWHADAERGIFLVVDGIGGQAAGEKAAAIAVERIRARLERQIGTAEQRVREAIAMANNEILRAARSNPKWDGMACVLTLAIVENGSAVIGHVGDSRLYQIRGGSIRKITSDHSPVGEREDRGELTEAEAMRHSRRNEVFRDVGSEPHEPDDPDFIEVQRIPFEADAALLLCSDGLSDQVPSGAIRAAVTKHAGAPEQAVSELIASANAAGGKDNVTVLIVEGERFVGEPEIKAAPAPYRRWAVLAAAGVLIAAAAFFGGRWSVPPPAPPPPPPRVIAAGSGGDYSSIADAVAAARAGDTVEVLAGEYREQVVLKTGVNVRSRVPLTAILRAAAVNPGPAILGEGVKQVRVSGFSIQADAAMPLAVGIALRDSEATVEDVEVGGAEVGIEIRGGAVSVIASSVHDCLREGIVISGATTPWISHNRVQRNKVAGLAARDGARPSLSGNLFEKNALELPADMQLTAVRQNNTLIEAPRRSRP